MKFSVATLLIVTGFLALIHVDGKQLARTIGVMRKVIPISMFVVFVGDSVTPLDHAEGRRRAGEGVAVPARADEGVDVARPPRLRRERREERQEKAESARQFRDA